MLDDKNDGIMRSYLEAAQLFRGSATEFIQHVHHLAEAREAYQRAIAASAEIRNSLDSTDESLRALMGQLEHALELYVRRPLENKKHAEAVKAEAMRATG